MSLNREEALSVLYDWRNRWEAAASEVYREADRLDEVTVVDLESQIRDVKYAAEACSDAVPCEDGLVEFIDDLELTDHEDCVPADEVVLSDLQLSNDSEIQRRGLVRKDQILSLLLAMETEMNVLRATMTQVRAELSRSEHIGNGPTVADRIQKIRSGE